MSLFQAYKQLHSGASFYIRIKLTWQLHYTMKMIDWRSTHPISPPKTSTITSRPMHTPRIGTFPVKNRTASREIPESCWGWPGPGDMIRRFISRWGSKDASIASLRMTVTSVPSRLSDWYRFQVNESKLSIIKQSIGPRRDSGSAMLGAIVNAVFFLCFNSIDYMSEQCPSYPCQYQAKFLISAVQRPDILAIRVYISWRVKLFDQSKEWIDWEGVMRDGERDSKNI